MLPLFATIAGLALLLSTPDALANPVRDISFAPTSTLENPIEIKCPGSASFEMTAEIQAVGNGKNWSFNIVEEDDDPPADPDGDDGLLQFTVTNIGPGAAGTWYKLKVKFTLECQLVPCYLHGKSIDSWSITDGGGVVIGASTTPADQANTNVAVDHSQDAVNDIEAEDGGGTNSNGNVIDPLFVYCDHCGNGGGGGGGYTLGGDVGDFGQVCEFSSGVVPDGYSVTGKPLSVQKDSGEALTLTWDPSCNLNDTDYAVYTGILGDFTSHTPVTCSTGGVTSWTFFPSGHSEYYLAVPRTALREGSYGVRSNGQERPQGSVSCVEQAAEMQCCQQSCQQ